jgi:hypothetical protein
VPAEGDGPGDIDIEGAERVDVLDRGLAAFDAVTRDPIFVTVPFSARVSDEVWSVTYEGELPRTSRGDWLLPTETTTATIDGEELEVIVLEASTDLCAAGVEVGDIFELATEPLPRDGCAVYTSETNPDFRNYRVVARGANTLTLAAIEGLAPLPVRAADNAAGCYESGVSGAVLAGEQWVVAGERTGYLSSKVAREGRCVAGRIGEAADGRVSTGDVYAGPTMSFRVYPGFVAPQRGLRFEFETQSQFASERIRTGPDAESVGLLPYHLFFREAEDSDDIEVLLATDPDTSFVYVRLSVPGLTDGGARQLFTYTDFLD